MLRTLRSDRALAWQSSGSLSFVDVQAEKLAIFMWGNSK